MDRGRGGKPRRGGGYDRRSARRGPPPRRTPPPQRTGLEATFLETVKDSGVRLVLVLADGRKVSGAVREFDRDQITIEETTGPIVIRKTEIRYLYEEP